MIIINNRSLKRSRGACLPSNRDVVKPGTLLQKERFVLLIEEYDDDGDAIDDSSLVLQTSIHIMLTAYFKTSSYI